jgi:pyruvate dehydrogenase E1 component
VPTVKAYDPAFAYEIALIVRDGIHRMYEKGEHLFYYLTVGNENYPMEPMPEGAAEGVVRGMYKFLPSPVQAPKGPKSKVHLLGSGSLLREAVRAQAILADRYGVAADVWSVTSYKELRREALECERWNRLHPTAPARRSYLETLLAKEKGIFIAVSDYMKSNQEQIQRWVPGGLTPLGTDGFGRSEDRPTLRRFFEVDAECITVAALEQLGRRGEIRTTLVEQAIKDLGIDPDAPDPVVT